MTWAPRSVTLALLSMALAGCAADDMPGSRDVIAGTYQCDETKTFSFTTVRGAETVTVEIDGASFELQQEPGLSGTSRYGNGTLLLWTRSNGRFANIEGTAEPFSNCEAVAWERGGVVY